MAYTGLPLAAMLTLAAACLLTGAVLLLVARTRPRRVSAAVILLLLVTGGVAFGLSDPPAARATTPSCATQAVAASNSLAIIQTSTLTGLAPGVAPAAIAGVVINRGVDSAYVTSITVSLVSVTQTLDHAGGRCNTSDYLLTGARMPVGQTIEPGESLDFGGARISFRNKSTNQDACQAATVTLRYVSA